MATFTDHDHTFAAICSAKDNNAFDEQYPSNGSTGLDAVNSRASYGVEKKQHMTHDPQDERQMADEEDPEGEEDEVMGVCDKLSPSSKEHILNNLLEPEVDLIEGDQSDDTHNHNNRNDSGENVAFDQNETSASKQPNVLRRVLTLERGYNDKFTGNGGSVMENVRSNNSHEHQQQQQQQYQEEEEDDDDFEDGERNNSSCRSLLCNSQGIIIAESIYRCIVCAFLSDSIVDAKRHYNQKHMQRSESKVKKSCTSKMRPKNRVAGRFATAQQHQQHQQQQQQMYSSSPDASHPTSPNEYSPCHMQMQMDEMEMDTDDIDNFSETDTAFDNVNSVDVFNEHRPKGKFVFSPSPADYVPGRNSIVKQSVTSSASASNQQHSSVRGGYVTCAVCSITKYYASVQRRYGQFTCMGCAKFFGRFLIKPRRYYCASLGSCPLDMTPRCKACLLLACINTYNIDEKRMRIVNANRPLNKSSNSTTVSRSSGDSGATGSGVSSASPGHHHQNNNSQSLSFAPPPLVAAKSHVASDARNASSEVSAKGCTSSLPLSSRPANNSTGHVTTVGRKGTGCRQCANCLADDCGKCNYCLDKPKFGGPNTLKKKCVQKKCLLVQPNTSVRVRSTTPASGLKDNNSMSNSKGYLSHLR